MKTRTTERIPAAWAVPGREAIEKKLRAAGIQEFTDEMGKLKCHSCFTTGFRVFIDRARCIRCHVYYKLEGPNQKIFTNFDLGNLKIGEHDQAIVCPKDDKHAFYIENDRLKCYFCRSIYIFQPKLILYWPMQEVGPKPETSHLSRSSIYRHLKKLKEEELS
jgi:hypothetical protein